MNIDTTIYGYVGDGEILCTKCAPADAEARPDEFYAIIGYNLSSALDPDDGYSLYCNGCESYIVEPDEPEADETDDDETQADESAEDESAEADDDRPYLYKLLEWTPDDAPRTLGDYIDDPDDETGPACPACNGTPQILGTLGSLTWLRCQQCGIDYHS